MKRLLTVQPAAVGAAAAATDAVAQMLWLWLHDHTGVFDQGVITAWVAALAALGVRQVVTPLARPRDNAGRELRPVVSGDSSRPAGTL
jgi:hypothetical protein